MSSAFAFGDFNFICERAALTVCPLLGTAQGVMPTCYSRNVQLGTQIIFQPGEFENCTCPCLYFWRKTSPVWQLQPFGRPHDLITERWIYVSGALALGRTLLCLRHSLSRNQPGHSLSDVMQQI